MRLLFLIILINVFIGITSSLAQTVAQKYIQRYQNIAVDEMHRTGIPASIKLGQAIIESNYGRSTLSTKSNNHFGIKCKKGWQGQKYYHKDDDRDKKGRLIKSCFRVYANVEASFVDHSEFLMKRDRYAFLFTFDQKDYKLWARGLKSAGYATAKGYDEKLIKVIEANNLHQYDLIPNPHVEIVLNHTFEEGEDLDIIGENTKPIILDGETDTTTSDLLVPPPPINTDYQPEQPEERISLFPKQEKAIFYVNKVKATAENGYSLEDIAKVHKVSIKRLLKYNDLESVEDKLLYGQYIFLKKKKKSYKQGSSQHTVKEGETMYSIAQLYGIKLKSLLKRNRLEKGQEPAKGEIIRLKGRKVKKAPSLSRRT